MPGTVPSTWAMTVNETGSVASGRGGPGVPVDAGVGSPGRQTGPLHTRLSWESDLQTFANVFGLGEYSEPQ